MAISQNTAGSQGTPGEYGNFTRRGVEDAAPYKACAVGRVPQNLQLPMALAERRYSQICKHARSAMPLSILAAPLPGSPRRPLASSQ